MLIGLTGGIASGKSLVADRLAYLGATIVDTDLISRELMQPGTNMLSQVVDRWGREVLNSDGTLNRKALGQRVFGDATATAALNRITHRAIMEEVRRRVEAATTPVVVAVIPLLFEAGAETSVDEVWLVTTPVSVQVERVMARDQLSAADAMNRIERQWPLDKKMAAADVIIPNRGTVEDLDVAVTAAWDRGLERWKA